MCAATVPTLDRLISEIRHTTLKPIVLWLAIVLVQLGIFLEHAGGALGRPVFFQYRHPAYHSLQHGNVFGGRSVVGLDIIGQETVKLKPMFLFAYRLSL